MLPDATMHERHKDISRLIYLTRYHCLGFKRAKFVQGQGQGNTVAPELFRSFTAFSGAHGQKTWLKEAKKWAKIAKQLSKARLSALVVSTTAVGFIAGKTS